MSSILVRASPASSAAPIRGDSRGQAIVLFAIFLVALLGIGAFALDVARVYALQRYERSVADAAALTGAQDLQDNPNTPTVSLPDYPRALRDSLTLLNNELGGATSSCTGHSQSVVIGGQNYTWYVDCPITGTAYTVTIKTPLTGYCSQSGTQTGPCSVDSDPFHAVQVTVQQSNVPLTLARLLGQNQWSVGETSVAGIDHTSRWAVETLRPPLPKGPGDQNYQDLNSNGTNTTLTVINGDIGTNTDASTNSGGTINLWDSYKKPSNGFYIWHIDPTIGWNQSGNPPLPAGRLLPSLLPDPQYYDFSSLPSTAGSISTCATQPPGLSGTWTCLTPGLYTSKLHYNASTNVYLEPGLYYFTGGLQVDGQLVAGNQAAATGGTCTTTNYSGCTGVTLVFSAGSYFKGNSATLIAINGGPAQPGYPNGDCAINSADCPTAPKMITLGTAKHPYIVPLSIAVGYVSGAQGSPGTCFNGTTPLNTCNNSTVIQLPGNGNLDVGGVTYAPTDAVQVNGNNTTSTGLVGQLIAWSIAYSGGAHVQQYYPGSVGNGVLHLDAACSGLMTPCYP